MDDDGDDVFGGGALFRTNEQEVLEYRYAEAVAKIISRPTDEQHITAATGELIWPASDILCHYLTSPNGRKVVESQRVLEVGAGVGLCGVIVSQLGCEHVIMTDYEESVLDNMQKNVELNSRGCSVSCERLEWGVDTDAFLQRHGKFNVVMGSDIVYRAWAIRPLMQTVSRLLSPDGVFILGYIDRGNNWDNLAEETDLAGLELTEIFPKEFMPRGVELDSILRLLTYRLKK